MRYDRTLNVSTVLRNGWIDDLYYHCKLKDNARIIKSIEPTDRLGHYRLRYYDNTSTVTVAMTEVDIYVRNEFPED